MKTAGIGAGRLKIDVVPLDHQDVLAAINKLMRKASTDHAAANDDNTRFERDERRRWQWPCEIRRTRTLMTTPFRFFQRERRRRERFDRQSRCGRWQRRA